MQMLEGTSQPTEILPQFIALSVVSDKTYGDNLSCLQSY
jgi:hypothetical protein